MGHEVEARAVGVWGGANLHPGESVGRLVQGLVQSSGEVKVPRVDRRFNHHRSALGWTRWAGRRMSPNIMSGVIRTMTVESKRGISMDSRMTIHQRKGVYIRGCE